MFPAGTIAESGEFKQMDQKADGLKGEPGWLPSFRTQKPSRDRATSMAATVGNQEKKDKPQKSSQAGGKDPNRGED